MEKEVLQKVLISTSSTPDRFCTLMPYTSSDTSVSKPLKSVWDTYQVHPGKKSVRSTWEGKWEQERTHNKSRFNCYSNAPAQLVSEFKGKKYCNKSMNRKIWCVAQYNALLKVNSKVLKRSWWEPSKIVVFQCSLQSCRGVCRVDYVPKKHLGLDWNVKTDWIV